MWPDNETTQDLLGFKVHADLIRSLVTNPELLPLTIGIFGDWGGGKTSILKMIERDLNPDNYQDEEEKKKYEKIACLYFNGWLFEGYDDAKSAILTSILLQLGEHKRFGAKIQDNVVSLLKSVNWMRLARLGMQQVALPAISAYLTGGASLIPSFAGAASSLFGIPSEDEDKKSTPKLKADSSGDTTTIHWQELIEKDKTASSPLDVRGFRERFGKMIQKSDIKSLIVLIDDLDRCSPERIIDNLEAIKLFLNVENTAFVIGTDPRIIRHAITQRYRTYEIGEVEKREEVADELVNDYLEKLIQVPYHLPKLSPAEIETYMALLFCKRDLDISKFRACLESCEKQRKKNRYFTFGYAAVKEAISEAEFLDSLAQSLAFCSSSAGLITEGLKGNPRQVKRFLNAFVIRKELAKVARLENVRDDVLVKLMVLEYSHPQQFQKLFDWQAGQDGCPDEIKQLEKILFPPKGELENEQKAKEIDPLFGSISVRKWVAMEPPLSDVDLRDYFWIARDRLRSTLSGLTMVPPIVRRLFEDSISDKTPRRNKAVETIAMELKEDELTALFELLKQHVLRNPRKMSGYEALRLLIEKDVASAGETLVAVLSTCPANSINPAVGPVLRTLIKSKPEVRELLQPSLKALSSTDTQIGRALKKKMGGK